MAQFVEFVINHWVLSVTFVVLLGLLIWTSFAHAGGARKISPLDATRLINSENAIVLDVRGDGEFGEGHIVNALHIPQGSLKERLDKLEKYKKRPIISTCRTGQQSASACSLLRKNGFEKVYSLSGGILAWQNASLPLTKND